MTGRVPRSRGSVCGQYLDRGMPPSSQAHRRLRHKCAVFRLRWRRRSPGVAILRRMLRYLVVAFASILALSSLAARAGTGVFDASAEPLRLYPADTFQAAAGKCSGCAASPQALWYFGEDLVGVAARSTAAPSLVWLGSSKVVDGAVLSPDRKGIDLGAAGKLPLALVPKLPTNLSYYDATTAEFFARRPLRLRGELVASPAGGEATFVARTIWPKDFTVEPGPVQALAETQSLQSLVRA